MSLKEIICYASCLGDCSTIQSSEHYVSKGLWKDKAVTVSGLPWLKGESKTMGVKKVARKILCTHHNRLLSSYDREGIKLFRTAEAFHQNQAIRGKKKRSAMWKTDRALMNGSKIERWLAKTAIGMLQEYPAEKWHLSNSPATKPPDQIIKSLYEISEFEYPMGLYLINAVSDQLRNEDRVNVAMLYHPKSKNFTGSIISYRDWQFLINLSDINYDDYSLKSLTGTIFGKDGSPVVYHIKQFNFLAGHGTGGGKLSGVISVEW